MEWTEFGTPVEANLGYGCEIRFQIAHRKTGTEHEIVAIVMNLTLQLTAEDVVCLLYTSPSPRDRPKSRMPSSA